METETKTEEIALIDKIKPVLTEKEPMQTLASLLCVVCFAFFMLGGSAGALSTIDLTKSAQPYRTAALIFGILVVSAGLAALSTISFIKRLVKLVKSPNSRKESQPAERASHNSSDKH